VRSRDKLLSSSTTSHEGLGEGFITGIGTTNATRNRGQHAAGVRQDDLQIRATPDRVRKHEIDNRARSIAGKFEQGRRTAEPDCIETGGCGGMQEDRCVPLVELVEDWRDRWIAEIFAIGVGLHNDTVETEFIEGMVAL
jgi:hypothetical protein